MAVMIVGTEGHVHQTVAYAEVLESAVPVLGTIESRSGSYVHAGSRFAA